jgi:hypothetical protein
LCSWTTEGKAADSCAKAFAYRAHSGYFEIVNSEEAYQNLWRFLFGDVRVDIWVHVDDIRLPREMQDAAEKGKKVNALYQIEALASARGKLWFLTRRVAEEDSVACLTYTEWKSAPTKQGALYLSTVFLANRGRVNKRRRSLSYSLQLGVRVPDYEVDNTLWFDKHYEGGYLFRDAIIIDLTPPSTEEVDWKIRYSWQGRGFSAADKNVAPNDIERGKFEVELPFDSRTVSGVSGRVRFVVSAWN